ncbi:MAG TPA: VOC family protein [Ktedonobacteraceae bacterium]|nr:VOC family protein [Ktedonobacteraceae bacterium]
MHIKTLQHCGLVVRDLERARWFYGIVLGMQEVPRPSNFKFGGAWFQGGDSQLHLILASDTTAPAGFVDAGPAKHTGLATHLAFEVDDLAAVQSTLEQYEVKILGGPMLRGDGAEQIYLHDPDGYLLEFYHWVGNAIQEAPERAAIHE